LELKTENMGRERTEIDLNTVRTNTKTKGSSN